MHPIVRLFNLAVVTDVSRTHALTLVYGGRRHRLEEMLIFGLCTCLFELCGVAPLLTERCSHDVRVRLF